MRVLSLMINGKGKELYILKVEDGWGISKMGSQMDMGYLQITMVMKLEEFGKMEYYNESNFY